MEDNKEIDLYIDKQAREILDEFEITLGTGEHLVLAAKAAREGKSPLVGGMPRGTKPFIKTSLHVLGIFAKQHGLSITMADSSTGLLVMEAASG